MGLAKGTRPGCTLAVNLAVSGDARDTADSGFRQHPVGVNLAKTDSPVAAWTLSSLFAGTVVVHGVVVAGGGVPGVWGGVHGAYLGATPWYGSG